MLDVIGVMPAQDFNGPENDEAQHLSMERSCDLDADSISIGALPGSHSRVACGVELGSASSSWADNSGFHDSSSMQTREAIGEIGLRAADAISNGECNVSCSDMIGRRTGTQGATGEQAHSARAPAARSASPHTCDLELAMQHPVLVDEVVDEVMDDTAAMESGNTTCDALRSSQSGLKDTAHYQPGKGMYISLVSTRWP